MKLIFNQCHTQNRQGGRGGEAPVALLHNMLRVLYLRRSRFRLWLRLGRGPRGLLLHLLHARYISPDGRQSEGEDKIEKKKRKKNKYLSDSSPGHQGRCDRLDACLLVRRRGLPHRLRLRALRRRRDHLHSSQSLELRFCARATERTGRCSRTAPLLVTSTRGVRPGRRSDASSRSLGTGMAGRPEGELSGRGAVVTRRQMRCSKWDKGPRCTRRGTVGRKLCGIKDIVHAPFACIIGPGARGESKPPMSSLSSTAGLGLGLGFGSGCGWQMSGVEGKVGRGRGARQVKNSVRYRT